MMQKCVKKQAKRYFKAVKKSCPFAFKKRLISALKNDINEYIEQNPSASFEDIKQHFGEPEQFALEYIAAMDDTDRMKAVSITRQLKIAVIIISIVGLIVSGCAIWIAIENSDSAIKIVEITVREENF